jgi:hypothetical protein
MAILECFLLAMWRMGQISLADYFFKFKCQSLVAKVGHVIHQFAQAGFPEEPPKIEQSVLI